MRLAEEMIERIVSSSQIPAGRRQQEIQRELRCHVDDLVAAAREHGDQPEDIERQVMARFGDPSQIARGFAWVYRRERRTLRLLAFALSTVLIASGLSAALLIMQSGLAFGFGIPIKKVLASPHTVFETLDIVASVAAYLAIITLENFFQSHRFQKAALLLTVIEALLILPLAAVGWRISFALYGLVNGVFFRAIQLHVTPKLARVGIVVLCFSLAGLISALRSPASHIALAATCASWLAMGIGYQFMSELAARVDSALLNGLQRLQQGY